MNPKEHDQYLLWLSHLQKGDRFAQRQHHWYTPIIHTVDRVTRTQIITDKGFRFSKGNGRQIGYAGLPRIEPMTDDIRQQIQSAKDRRRLSDFARRPELLSPSEVRAMLDALDRERSKEKDV